jgi:enoyl-CoA hydratase
MQEPGHILTEQSGGIGRLTFNRPKKLNAFNNEMMRSAMAAMDSFAVDDDVHVVIVSGAGRAFSAGFDLAAAGERKLDSIDKVRSQMELQFDFIMKFWDSPKPTIAAVHGFCLAGAFEVSLACDITIASEDAVFGEPEVRFGTGAVAMAGKIAKSSSVSVRLSKQAINRSYEIMGMRQALLSGLDLDVEINSTPSWEKQEFARIRKEQGVNAAIAWRDERFSEDL